MSLEYFNEKTAFVELEYHYCRLIWNYGSIIYAFYPLVKFVEPFTTVV